MSDCPETTVPAVARLQPAAARAARLVRFEREQLIVGYLNRGVSVAEIAARVGVGEKRMRAIIREILARRMPAPPEEFVAIQLSRLNEALLVAFSAMTDMNLNAVDRVVRIVRDLDRYHGLAAVARRRPEPSRLKARRDGSIEHVARVRNRIAFFPSAAVAADDAGWDKAQDSLEAVAARPGPCPDLPDSNEEIGRGAPPALNNRPQNPPQRIERLQSAPGPATPAGSSAPSAAPVREADDKGAARVAEGSALSWLRAVSRPGIPPQRLERFESTPGRAVPRRAPALVAGTSMPNATVGVETCMAVDERRQDPLVSGFTDGTPRGAAGSASETSLG